jgi:cysteinyl-tRNA synthetase
LKNAKAALERLQTSYQNLKHRLEASTNLTDDDQKWLDQIANFHHQFIEEMDDDFNTANAISVLFEVSKLANYYLMEKNTSAVVIRKFLETFEQFFNVLGLELTKEQLLDEEIEQLITKRNEARKNRDFHTADRIRDQLKEMNIVLEDTPQGTRWKRS